MTGKRARDWLRSFSLSSRNRESPLEKRPVHGLGPSVHASGRVLPALAAGLALLFAAEWLLPGAGPSEGDGPPAIPAAPANAGSDAAINQWAATMLARPLFDASRRPEAAPASVTDDLPPHLTAIIINGAGRYAVFSASGEKPQDVPEGGGIGGYLVKTIAADRVQLLGPGGPLTLRPQFAAIAGAD